MLTTMLVIYVCVFGTELDIAKTRFILTFIAHSQLTAEWYAFSKSVDDLEV